MLLAFLGGLGLQTMFYFSFKGIVNSAHRREKENGGQVVLSSFQYKELRELVEKGSAETPLGEWEWRVARSMRRECGGEPLEIQRRIGAQYKRYGVDGFVAMDGDGDYLEQLRYAQGLPLAVGLFMLLWWCAVFATQGEGGMMDLQRRRYPLWGWLFSHPVAPGAVFFAEMLAPLAANPLYWSGPFFFCLLFGEMHGLGVGLCAMVAIGIPCTVAMVTVGKAIETWAMLRVSMKARGVIMGSLWCFGFGSLMAMIFGYQLPALKGRLLDLMQLVSGWGSSAWVKYLLGYDGEGELALGRTFFLYAVMAMTVTGAAVWVSVRATNAGLAGGFGTLALEGGKKTKVAKEGGMGRDPLFRKEMLWFKRDRGAVIQVVVIPLMMVLPQLFNYSNMFATLKGEWTYLAGMVVMVATYFLLQVGPRSLASEGAALWIAWTWPRGMEELLQAKARMWARVAAGLVGVALVGVCWMFPDAWWKLGLVGLAWYAFGRSLALKAVTLVTHQSDSGETEPVSMGRRWATYLGSLTFALGVFSERWSLMLVGVVYSWMTAAAMWQNFRARIPFLYDPWSERDPQAPSLMHAMVAIAAMIEVTSVVSVATTAWAVSSGRNAAVGVAIAYAGVALLTCGIMIGWLESRHVKFTDVTRWHREDGVGVIRTLQWLGAGVMLGAATAGIAQLYIWGMQQVPGWGEPFLGLHRQLAGNDGLRWAYGVMAVIFAPLAEEYLFRGLLLRALDREWGGWKALLGSAAFFASCHPVSAWVPVGLLGLVCGVLFKKCGSLWPCVLAHAVYNLIVVWLI